MVLGGEILSLIDVVSIIHKTSCEYMLSEVTSLSLGILFRSFLLTFAKAELRSYEICRSPEFVQGLTMPMGSQIDCSTGSRMLGITALRADNE